MRMDVNLRVPCILILGAMLILACVRAAPAQAQDKTPFVGVWIDDKATLTDEAVQTALTGLAQQEADPQHIIVLVHGFATPRAESTKQFTRVATDGIKAYQALGQRVAVLGIQWDSDVGPTSVWLPKVIKGLGGKDNPYMKKVGLAVDVGHVGARQILLAVMERFPNTNIDVFAHSLGTQVIVSALGPGLTDANTPKGSLETYKPEKPLQVNLICLAGADLDYNILSRSNSQVRRQGVAKMFWLTLAGRGAYQPLDAVLSARTLLRGDAALGNRFPRLTTAQMDGVCKNRRLILDTIDIPPKHELLKYYLPKRLGRLADVAVGLHDPSHPSKLLQKLDKIIAAPSDPKVLEEFFRDFNPTVQFYTLWRMETIYCGGPFHLSDGYLAHMIDDVSDRPELLEAERLRSPCQLVIRGIWPTVRMIQHALDTMPGGRGTRSTSGGFDMP